MKARIIERMGLAFVAAALAGSVADAQETPIPAAGVRADLRLAVRTIELNHPDLSHSVQKRRLEAALRRIEHRLKRLVTQGQAWFALAQLNPVLADGHLFIGFPDWREAGARAVAKGSGLFPFEVSIDPTGNLRIVAVLGGGPTPLAGQYIQRINGQDAGQVVRALSARAHGDTPAFRSALLARRWWFYYAEAFGTPAMFEIDLKAAGREKVAASRENPAFLKQEGSFEQTYRCDITEKGAVLTASSFAWPDKAQFLAFTHDCFARIAALGVHRLIIDVRRNGGGDDDLWREGILHYIADRPYKHGSRYLKRVLQPQPGETPGEVVAGTIESAAMPPAVEPLRFKGEVYVLVGRQTYSSAVLFSNVVQDYGFGKIAGTGGAVRTRQSGGVQSLRLPNTGLLLFYPRFVLDRPSGAAIPTYVEPDLRIPENPLDEHAAVEALLNAR